MSNGRCFDLAARLAGAVFLSTHPAVLYLPFPIYPLLLPVKWYREDSIGVTFSVRVIPRASRTEIVGLHQGALKIRIAAPPVEGAANDELVRFLSKKFKVARAAVTLVAGANSRNKVVRLANLTAATRAELSKLELI